MTMKPPLYVIGMHGLGDNIHQRAIMKHLTKTHEIWLETSWPQIYHDMPDLHLLNKGTSLRTQLKNARMNTAHFDHEQGDPLHSPERIETLRIFYRPENVRSAGSVMQGMVQLTGLDIPSPDYSLPIPAEWRQKALNMLTQLSPDKPVLIYRPLIERTEWSGCASRNPDYTAYSELLTAVRDDYFVISIADCEPGVEWIVGNDIKADAEFHRGELDFETIAGLVSIASLVYGSPGFAIVMARSMQTPVVCVFGGYENSASFSYGPGAYLGIDPIHPCACFSHSHPCKKSIDLVIATTNIKGFSSAALTARKN